MDANTLRVLGALMGASNQGQQAGRNNGTANLLSALLGDGGGGGLEAKGGSRRECPPKT